MDFERYDPDVHSQYVKPDFAENVEETNNFSDFRPIVEEALEDYDNVFGIKTDFDVVIAETIVEPGDPVGTEYYTYINGMGITENSEYFDRNLLLLRISKEPEKWRSFLKSLVVHEASHIEFQTRKGTGKTIAYHLLMEGHTMHSDRVVSEKKDYDWRQKWELPEIDKQEFLEELDKKRSWNQPQSDEISTIFEYGGEKWRKGEGYSLAYHITGQVMENKGLSEKDLINVDMEKWIEYIKEAVEQLY